MYQTNIVSRIFVQYSQQYICECVFLLLVLIIIVNIIFYFILFVGFDYFYVLFVLMGLFNKITFVLTVCVSSNIISFLYIIIIIHIQTISFP